MICQFCRKKDATIHFTNVDGNDVQKIHLCRACAEARGFDYLKRSNFEALMFLHSSRAMPPRYYLLRALSTTQV